MGKASSAKKVAKAQKVGSSGRTTTDRKVGFPLAVGLVIVLGLGLVVAAKASTTAQADVPPRLGGLDHWNQPWAVYVCDSFIPEPAGNAGRNQGIEGEGTGEIHVHPSSSNVAGENATFSVFTDNVGIDLGDDSFTMPNGDSYATGEDCNGEEGVVRLLKWSGGDFAAEPEVFDSNIGDVRFIADGEAFVLAFAPADADIPLPPVAAQSAGSAGPAPGGEDPVSVSIPEGVAGDSGPAVTVEEAPATTAAPTE